MWNLEIYSSKSSHPGNAIILDLYSWEIVLNATDPPHSIVVMYFMLIWKHIIKDIGMVAIYVFKHENTKCIKTNFPYIWLL